MCHKTFDDFSTSKTIGFFTGGLNLGVICFATSRHIWITPQSHFQFKSRQSLFATIAKIDH
ncbi:hypothetical protein SmphiM12_498 [Sinorhizobium phage phiM12]|uniref:Uncharacterized protein n=1 Tax=Sinorhizobium phage phiM12 TaxID=1357423 RepID=A0A068NZA0_9CAUD|nr:hypothetical protein AB690_gp052 [Sinorhizobium phage phiM12]AIF27791.1 hypothetical protein SmphiM12_498 [Sinorhizobium phage phiM12]